MSADTIAQAIVALLVMAVPVVYTHVKFKREQAAREREAAAAQALREREAADKAALDARKETSAERHLTYDQLQEDAERLRAQVESDRVAAAQVAAAQTERERRVQLELDYAWVLVRHLEDELVEERQDIAAGRVPPLKPRKPYPSRPS